MNRIIKENLLQKFLLYFFIASLMGFYTNVVHANEIIHLTQRRSINFIGDNHTFFATVFDDATGKPVQGKNITYKALGGPHFSQIDGVAVQTGGDGRAKLTITGSFTGIDTVESSFVDSQGNKIISNQVRNEWIERPPVCPPEPTPIPTLTVTPPPLPTIEPSPTPAPTPEIINDLVIFEPITSTYTTTSDTTGCPPEFIGKFSFDAKLTNRGSSPPLSNLVAQVKKLTKGNLLHNADGGHGGEGSIMTIPLMDAYADGVLSPGEFVTVHFIICLQDEKPFTFLVDVLGVGEGVSAALQLTNDESRRVKFRKGSRITGKGFFGRFRP